MMKIPEEIWISIIDGNKNSFRANVEDHLSADEDGKISWVFPEDSKWKGITKDTVADVNEEVTEVNAHGRQLNLSFGSREACYRHRAQLLQGHAIKVNPSPEIQSTEE